MEDTGGEPKQKKQKVDVVSRSELQQLRAEMEQQRAEMEQKQKAEMEQQRAEMEQQRAEMEQKQKAEFRQLRAESQQQRGDLEEQIGRVKMSNTKKGVTTQAEFFNSVIQDGLLETKSFQNDVWGYTEKWPLDDPPSEPEENASEAGPNGVQSVVTGILEKLKEHAANDENSERYVSIPDPYAYKKPSFRTRKPDVVNHLKDLTGTLAISSFGDLKRRGNSDFSNDEKGHILDMARSFLQHVGMSRPFIFVFLSDGKRWQFFRVVQTQQGSSANHEREFRYWMGPVIDNAVVGWKHYVALLTANVHILGCREPMVPGIELIGPLGRGGSAVVYEGEYTLENEKTKVVVKVFFAGRKDAYTREVRALEKLVGISGVPTLVTSLPLSNEIDGFSGDAIIATPVGQVFAPAHKGASVHGKHLKELVHILKAAHSKGLEHRDVKPDNIYMSGGSMLLNDWSSAVFPNVDAGKWEGTLGFSVSPNDETLGPAARDLVSAVRTAYSLLFHEMPFSKDEDDALKFWRENVRKGTVWEEAMNHAKQLKYDDLAKTLERLK